MPICGKIIIPGLYGFVALCFFLQFIFSRRSLGRLAFRIFWIGIVLHTLFVIYYYWKLGYPFVEKPADLYQFISWLIALSFIVACKRYTLESGGVFFVTLSLVFFLASLFFHEGYALSYAFAHSPWSAIHIFFALLALTLFAVSFFVGLLYLLQEYQLKQKRFFLQLPRIPSLEDLDQMHNKALKAGFILLTCMLVSGFLLSYDVTAGWFGGGSKQLVMLVAWGLYAVLLNFRVKEVWRGHRGVLLSLAGFLLIIGATLGMKH